MTGNEDTPAGRLNALFDKALNDGDLTPVQREALRSLGDASPRLTAGELADLLGSAVTDWWPGEWTGGERDDIGWIIHRLREIDDREPGGPQYGKGSGS